MFIDGDVFHVFYQGASLAFEWQNLMAHAADAEHEGRLTAPMPGKVIAVLVETGASVEKGAPLLVMEAMKMEHTIVAPSTGKVGEILFGVGDQVADGAQLLIMEASSSLSRFPRPEQRFRCLGLHENLHTPVQRTPFGRVVAGYRPQIGHSLRPDARSRHAACDQAHRRPLRRAPTKARRCRRAILHCRCGLRSGPAACCA